MSDPLPDREAYLRSIREDDHALARLLRDPQPERGLAHTPREIAQQPLLWRRTARDVRARAEALSEFLREVGFEERSSADAPRVVFTGAGSSDYVGRSVADLLGAEADWRVAPIPSTRLVAAPAHHLAKGRRQLVIHCSRSGESPESRGVFEWVRANRPNSVRQLVITCNPEGTLAELARRHPERSHLFLVDEAARDEGLAMTGSFTSMVVAAQGLAFLDRPDLFVDRVDRVAREGERVIESYADLADRLGAAPIDRAFFLGNDDLLGAAVESALKIQELTAGDVVGAAEDTLAFRHGPISAVTGRSLVCFYLSNRPAVRRYERDVRTQYREVFDEMGVRTLVLEDLDVPSLFQVNPAVALGQLLGLFAALHRGHHVDDPAREKPLYGRTVEGVRIYPNAEKDTPPSSEETTPSP